MEFNISLKVSLVLFLIGFVISGLLGWLLKNSKRWRLLKAIVVATMCSWSAIFAGYGNFGFLVLPSPAMFWLAYIYADPVKYENMPKLYITEQISGLHTIMFASFFSYLLVLCCFWFFSRKTKLSNTKPYDKSSYEKIL